jgi:hypothetical protein
MADRVFEDRLGLWVINPANLPDRLPRIRAFGGGIIRDLFLPRSSTLADFARVRQAELSAHLYVSPDGLTVEDYAARTLADLARLKPGAIELNIELPSDPPLAPYIRAAVAGIRAQRRHLRLRVNVAPWKGFALPGDLLVSDPALYACEQNYGGNMQELYSAADVLDDLRLGGVPAEKRTVCYAAACQVLDSPARVRTLPDLSRTRRGVIFQDDLMVEAGLL